MLPHVTTPFSFNQTCRKKTLEFVCGDGQVADALEFAIMEMKKGEKVWQRNVTIGQNPSARL